MSAWERRIRFGGYPVIWRRVTCTFPIVGHYEIKETHDKKFFYRQLFYSGWDPIPCDNIEEAQVYVDTIARMGI
jgi:hypothetical protein